MQPDDITAFLKWAASLPIKQEVAEKLLPHLPDSADLDPELPNWIESAQRIISMNDPKHGFGLPKDPIDDGFLVIGSCPNGDPVAVNFRDPRLPVFYISHEQMRSNPFAKVTRKVSDSIAEYDGGDFRRELWHSVGLLGCPNELTTMRSSQQPSRLAFSTRWILSRHRRRVRSAPAAVADLCVVDSQRLLV